MCKMIMKVIYKFSACLDFYREAVRIFCTFFQKNLLCNKKCLTVQQNAHVHQLGQHCTKVIKNLNTSQTSQASQNPSFELM